MLLQVDPNAAALITDYHHYRVEVKQYWATNPQGEASQWAALDYLEVKQVTQAVAPSMPTARCVWRAGQIKRTDRTDFPNVRIGDFAGWYMRIVLVAMQKGHEEQTIFVGRFGSDDRMLGGSDTGSYADQELTVYGLASDLDRNAIRKSWVNTNSGYAEVDTDIAFNERYERGFSEVGNKSYSAYVVNGQSVFVFDGSGSDATTPALVWTAKEMIEHLLAFHGPEGMPIKLAGQVDALSVIDVQRVSIYGQTLWSALNEIIDRKRGLGFYLTSDEAPPVEGEESADPNTVTLRVFTVNDEPVAVGDVTIPANANARSIVIARDLPKVVDTTFTEDFASRFGKIIVSGERLVSCGTFSFKDGSMEVAWSTDLETEYKAGAAASTDNARANDQFRGDDKFSSVYTSFRVKKGFDWYSLGGEGPPGASVNLNPKVLPTGEINLGSQGAIRNWGLVASRHIPLRHERTEKEPDPDYRKMLAFIYDPDTKRWINAEASKGIGSLRPLQNDLGVELTTSDRQNHLLAKNHWTDAKATSIQPRYDYEKLIFTFAVALDQRVAIEVVVKGGDPARVLHIPVQGAEVHYVAQNTVVGVEKDGKLVRYSGAQFPRDDRDRLRMIAAQAKAWYGKKRTTATLTGEAIWNHLPLGTYITRCERPTGHTAVNGVVSSITYDFGAPQRTTIKTSFGELDLDGGPKNKHRIK